MLHPLWFTPVHKTLAKIVAPRLGERIMDVGAGTGALTDRLSRSGASVLCLEPDETSLVAARDRLTGRKNVEFLRAPVERIPVPDASVDAAVASVTAHHWSDPQGGFVELGRVIRPGGRLAVAEIRTAGPLRRMVRHLTGSKHVDTPSFDEWRSRLTKAGFHDVEAVPAGWMSAFALFMRATR